MLEKKLWKSFLYIRKASRRCIFIAEMCVESPSWYFQNKFVNDETTRNSYST